MARINLLPWREERRKERQREFIFMLVGAAIIGGLLFYAATWQIDKYIDHQRDRNNYLTEEIKDLDRKIAEIKELENKRRKMLARKQIIEELQASRSQMVHLFDELVRTIPEGAQLNSVKQQGDTLTLSGLAQSNARVSAYMRNLDASEWLEDPDLVIIQAKPQNANYKFEFSLRVKLSRPKTDDDEALSEEIAV